MMSSPQQSYVPARPDSLNGPPPEQVVLANFLVRYREPTRSHHLNTLRQWFHWCHGKGLAPMEATRSHVELYARELEELKGNALSTIAGKLASLNKFYWFAMMDRYIPANPVEYVKRPTVPRVSSTNGLTRPELYRLLEAAKARHPRDHALLCVLALNGLRIGEALAIQVEDIRRDGAYIVLTVKREKGGGSPEIPLTSRTHWAVEQYAYGRSSGPLFLNRKGGAMDRDSANRVLQRHAKTAGITKRITPHSLRHTFVTLALDAGVATRDVANSVGHRDERQVAYYDRAKNSLPKNATHAVSAYVEMG